MPFVTWFIVIGLAVWAGLLVRLARRRTALRRTPLLPPALARYPSLSVIHPIRGLDPGSRGNIAAALDIAYPGELENVFVFDDEEEPALPLVREAMAERERRGERRDTRVLIAGPPRPGYTGKLSAMNAGVAAAKGELIAFADSDIRVNKNIVRVLVDLLLGSPRAGAAFAPVVVAKRARTAGDVGYQLMLNSLYSPDIALWDRQGRDLPFIMGQLMVFRRATLQAIGGVDCARGQLVDDMHIGTHIVAAGLRNVMSAQPIRIVEWGLSLGEFARCARRWLMFSRKGIPGRFALGAAFHFVAFWLGLVGLGAALSAGSLPAAIVGAGLMVSSCAEVLALNRYAGGPRTPLRWWWVPALLLFSGPFVYLTTWFWPEVRWRGRLYGLNVKAELAAGHAPLAGRVRRALHMAADGHA